MKIRVLHIYFGGNEIGGMEKMAWYLAKEMDRDLFELHFCHLGDGKGEIKKKLEDLGCPIYVFNAGPAMNFSLSYWKATFEIVRLIKRINPHIVHTWDTDGNLAGRIAAVTAKVPVLIANEINRSDLSPQWLDRILTPVEKFLNLILDPLTDRVICDSEDIRQHRGKGGKFQIIYCPFDSERFLKTGERYDELRSQDPNQFILGIVARLDIQKGHRYLLEAMHQVVKKFPRTKLFIVGKGNLEESLKKQVRLLGISKNVIFKGEMIDGVPEFLCSLDAFVHSSLFEGGGPGAILEAMAVGLPIVATKIGGINESVINGITGILVPPKNSKALADAIIALLSNKAHARVMGQNGRKRVSEKRFQLQSYINEIKKLYQELLSSKFTHEPSFCNVSYKTQTAGLGENS